MYAVIRSGGKQYRVEQGDVVRLERIAAEPGEKVTFHEVLLVGKGSDVRFGEAAKAEVIGVVTQQGRGKKVIVFKKRRRKNYRRTKGHRQAYTAVRIEQISFKE